MQRAILFFVKAPVPGQVKTRLAHAVGPEEAAAIYRQLVTAVCRLLPRDVQVLVFFEPPDERLEIELWLRPLLDPQVWFFPQSSGDLGTRLTDAFQKAFDLGAQNVLVIGSDCVELDAGLFNDAWRSLASHDCVLGPAADGGYYLVGLKRPAPEIFRAIPWSSAHTLSATLDCARVANLRVHLLPERNDVDTEIDWKRAKPHVSF